MKEAFQKVADIENGIMFLRIENTMALACQDFL